MSAVPASASAAYPCRKPCRECPWSTETPPYQFPRVHLEEMRNTTGSPGDDRPYGSPLFSCHLGKPDAEFPCAGWLAAVGYWNITVRVLVALGKIPAEALNPGDDWPELFPSFAEMVEAQGG